MMRIDGKLSRWNDERGYGFIVPARGGSEIFVHVSAFPKDGHRPQLGEPVTFLVETGTDGRKRAISVERPAGLRPTAAPVPLGRDKDAANQPRPKRRGLFGRVILPAVVLAVAAFAYSQYAQRNRYEALVTPAEATPAPAAAATARAEPPFRCDGRTRCPQMTSCAEATFFLKHCPNTEMDGDGDGIPCEQQWCGR